LQRFDSVDRLKPEITAEVAALLVFIFLENNNSVGMFFLRIKLKKLLRLAMAETVF